MIDDNLGGRHVKDFRENLLKRMRIVMLLLIGAFAILMIRVGYMSFIYQNNIVTLAHIDQKAKEQNNVMIAEIKDRFDIQLDQFREVSTEELILSGKTDVETLSLLDTITTACEQGCIGQPALYLHEAKGFVFLKNSEEQDVLIEIEKQKDHWVQISKQTVD